MIPPGCFSDPLTPQLLQVPGLCILSYPAPLYFGTRGQFRHNLEEHLGLGRGKVRDLVRGECGFSEGEADGFLTCAQVRTVMLEPHTW